jgi:hypothetical protein
MIGGGGKNMKLKNKKDQYMYNTGLAAEENRK